MSGLIDDLAPGLAAAMATTTPAPMTAERLAEAREFLEPSDRDHEHDFEERAVTFIRDLLSDHDAAAEARVVLAEVAAARIAELQREVAHLEQSRSTIAKGSILGREREGVLAEMLNESETKLTERIITLESELAAARKPPEDGEVAKIIKQATECADSMERTGGWKTAASYFRQCTGALTRLSAALKEAEAQKSLWENTWTAWQTRALAAEAKLETARRDALEEAARACFPKGKTYHPDVALTRVDCADAIRALKDTAP